MNLEKVFVADIETKGFLDKLNSFEDFHVLGIGWKDKEGNWQIKTTNKFEDVQKVFGNKDNVIVMHNGIRYDKPALEKMGVEVNATIIDSLPLAWNLHPERGRQGKKYGLEYYGEDYGIPKPKIEDWENLSYEEYCNRVTEDVKINIMLWENLYQKGLLVYEGMQHNFIRLINLLNFIMTCAHKQEMEGLYVDIKKTKETLEYFEKLKEDKVSKIKEAMPKVPIFSIRTKPNNMYKKDGSLSVAGARWKVLTEGCGLDIEYEGSIKEIIKYEEPNPNSVDQKKKWLYSLGWEPKTLKHNRDKITGEVKVVEQIMTEDKMLCPSVLKLAEKEPAIEHFDGLTVLTHRIGILKSFLSNVDESGMIIQGLQQLAVSMRWQHSIIVNMPRYTGRGDLRDGKWIRECLIAPPGKKIIQADLSGIESRTSDHYIFNINRDRVVKTQKPFFDPHTEISVFASLMTPSEETFYIFKSALESDSTLDLETFSDIYKSDDEVRRLLSLPEEEQKKLIKHLKTVRSKGKTCNYASLYNVGAKTLARNLEIPEKEAKDLIDAYWKIHFAVKVFTESLQTKKVEDEMWVFNPISNFFYYVRNSKDLFSIVNQSSAVYCFNMWVYFITKRGIFPVTQTHDDCVLLSNNDEVSINKTRQVFHDAMDDLNNYLKLNVKLDCESQIGDNLAETH